jgi:hypothetical protein
VEDRTDAVMVTAIVADLSDDRASVLMGDAN